MRHESESEEAQLCPTCCDPTDCSLSIRLLCPWDFPGKSAGVDCHFLLQGIFPTQGSNPGLSHCRQTLYCVSHQGSPIRTYIKGILNELGLGSTLIGLMLNRFSPLGLSVSEKKILGRGTLKRIS